MNTNELMNQMEELRKVFPIVRLVDVDRTKCLFLLDNGDRIEESGYCYDMWNKQSHCEKCVAMKAHTQKGLFNTVEFVNGEAYFIMAKDVEIDGANAVLEMITAFSDSDVFEEAPKNEQEDGLGIYNKKRYIDQQTGAYNRKYLDEQILAIDNYVAMAKIRVDEMESIYANNGMFVGDLAIAAVASVMLRSIRTLDVLIRYGKNEFLLLFKNIPEEVFPVRLEAIRKAVTVMRLDAYPRIKLSVSIGGVYCPGKSIQLMLAAAERILRTSETGNCVRVTNRVNEEQK